MTEYPRLLGIITADGVLHPPPPDESLTVDPACPFKVGDRVRLTRHGLTQIGGLRTPEAIEAHQKGSVIERIAPAHTEPPAWCIYLDGPLGVFLLTDRDIERLL